jgi:hypothetical protein
LAEREATSGIADVPKLVYGLKDRQQIEIKATQIEHDAASERGGG